MNYPYKNNFLLHGRVAIVTGGLGILGKHFCASLAEHGANVVIVDLDEEAAQNYAFELEGNYKVECLGIGCNVSCTNSVQKMTARVMDRFNRIDILHNNAASKSTNLEEFFSPFETYDYEQWKKIMEINVDGMFLIAQSVGKIMCKQKKGSIIQTSSIYGLWGPDQRIYEGSEYNGIAINTPAVYSTSKAGVIGLTKYLATYWSRYNIRVNCLVPGGVESGQNEIFKRKYSERVPLGRMARPEEMAGALIFLASDASSYVTGQILSVDGGLGCW